MLRRGLYRFRLAAATSKRPPEETFAAPVRTGESDLVLAVQVNLELVLGLPRPDRVVVPVHVIDHQLRVTPHLEMIQRWSNLRQFPITLT